MSFFSVLLSRDELFSRVPGASYGVTSLRHSDVGTVHRFVEAPEGFDLDRDAIVEVDVGKLGQSWIARKTLLIKA